MDGKLNDWGTEIGKRCLTGSTLEPFEFLIMCYCFKNKLIFIKKRLCFVGYEFVHRK